MSESEQTTSAAQKWRDRLGVSGPPPAPGTAAQRWRARLAPAPAPAAPMGRMTQALALPALALMAVPALAAPPQLAAQSDGLFRPAGLGLRSPTMDACRVLRLNLLAGAAAPPPLVLIAPAAEPACALLAAGLAMALAEGGCRTLLVDADLRAPMLHTAFGIGPGGGLAAALGGDQSQLGGIEVLPGLRLLTAGAATNGLTLAGSPALPRVTRALAQQHEAVIYHVAQRRSSADALQLATHVGAALFSLRAGVDSAGPVRRMRATLERAGAQVLGFALVGEASQ